MELGFPEIHFRKLWHMPGTGGEWHEQIITMHQLHPTFIYYGLPVDSGSVVKNLPANEGDQGSYPWFEMIRWRRKQQPALVFLPGKSHGLRSLVGYTVHGVTESRNNNNNQVTGR